MSEDKIQHEIVMWLQDQKIYFFSVPNEGAGKDAVIRMTRLKAMGLRPGTSDLVLVLPNRVVFVEVKTDTGIQSKLQKVFQERVTALGHEYLLVRSLKDLVDNLVI